MKRFQARFLTRLMGIVWLVCFILLTKRAINSLVVSNWPGKANQSTPEPIESRMMTFNFSFQKDDLLDILKVPIQTIGPEVPRIILHNPLLCGHNSSTLDFVIYVHSSTENWARRQTLRSTYANPKLFKNVRFEVLFVLGLSKLIGVQQRIKKEFNKYGDIVQGDFIDAYRNMTLKAIFALTWISEHCSQADYAMKIDDDAFVDLFKMASLMHQNLNNPLVVICPVWPDKSVVVFRDRKECMKWCVSFRQFRAASFPMYCSGLSYTFSRELIPQLAEAVAQTPFFWVDDVYVTGFLVKKLNSSSDVRFVTILNQMELNSDKALDVMANKSMPLTKHLFHLNNQTKFVKVWQLWLKRLTKKQKTMIDLSTAITPWIPIAPTDLARATRNTVK